MELIETKFNQFENKSDGLKPGNEQSKQLTGQEI
jgi:hypothetical protein